MAFEFIVMVVKEEKCMNEAKLYTHHFTLFGRNVLMKVGKWESRLFIVTSFFCSCLCWF